MAMQNYGGIWRDLDKECAEWNSRQACYAKAGEYHKRLRIAQVCARFEIEPDEFFTAEQKSQRLIKAGEA